MRNHQERVSLRTRWLLEYRVDENENKKPKAPYCDFWVILIQTMKTDPGASPTMTRNTRQFLLQFGAMDGILGSQGRRQRSQSSCKRSAILPFSGISAVALNGSSWWNHEVEEGSLRIG